jgi:hypothetical protein
MKKKNNCLILLITFIFLFMYLDFLDIPIYLNSNISIFIGNPLIRFVIVILIIYIGENISYIGSIGLVFIYLFLLNNSMRSNNFEQFTTEDTINNVLNGGCDEKFEVSGGSLDQRDPIAPPGSSPTPKGPMPLNPNNWIGPLPFRPCESVLSSGAPDPIPPSGDGFSSDPPGPYTDSGIGCSL